MAHIKRAVHPVKRGRVPYFLTDGTRRGSTAWRSGGREMAGAFRRQGVEACSARRPRLAARRPRPRPRAAPTVVGRGRKR
jgi:hypothetical protein